MVVTGVMGAWQSLGVTLAVGVILVVVAQKVDVYQRQVSHHGNYLQRSENISFPRRHFRHNSVGSERADHPVHPVA
jgi:hypothetical protein